MMATGVIRGELNRMPILRRELPRARWDGEHTNAVTIPRFEPVETNQPITEHNPKTLRNRHIQTKIMTRVLLTGGSGFIAAHALDILLEHGHSVVTTVRTQEKADKIKAAYKSYAEKGVLDFAIVPDIAQPDAFEKAVVSDPPFEAVLHTASPFHFNVTNVQKV